VIFFGFLDFLIRSCDGDEDENKGVQKNEDCWIVQNVYHTPLVRRLRHRFTALVTALQSISIRHKVWQPLR